MRLLGSGSILGRLLDCRVSGSIPGPLHQDLYFHKTPRSFVCTFKFRSVCFTLCAVLPLAYS